MLVLPFKMNEKTKGGIILAETSLETTTSCIDSADSFLEWDQIATETKKNFLKVLGARKKTG